MGNCQSGCCGDSAKDEVGTEANGEQTKGTSITYKDNKITKQEKPKPSIKGAAKNLKNVRNFEFRCPSILNLSLSCSPYGGVVRYEKSSTS